MKTNSAIALPALTVTPAAEENSGNRELLKEGHLDQPDHFIQFKLSVGAADDPMETEADVMADRVMKMPEQNFIQRKCAECEEEETLQQKPQESFIQRKGTKSNSIASDTVTSRIYSSKGSGSKMDSPTTSFMESRFGADFSNIKIHNNNESAELNRELSARAFTVGNDIYFNQGEYQPGSSTGKHLLAHELTHTVQQNFSKSYLQPKPVIRRALAPVVISSIADEIRDATEGWGTDEEKIFMNLQKLNRDPAEITALMSAYQAKYHESLEALLRDEMSGSELRLALEEINIIDDPREGPMIAKGPPANAAEYKLAAQRLYNAMEGLGTDEETIYAVLIPLSKDPPKITEMQSAYLSLTGHSLIADIRDEMSSTELDYALYLLNTTAEIEEVVDEKVSELEAIIYASSAYKKLKKESKDRVKRIIQKASLRPPGENQGQRYYYLVKLNVALTWPFNGVDSGDEEYGCSPDADVENRAAVDAALDQEKKDWDALLANAQEDALAAAANKVPREGEKQNDKKKTFLVDASDPTNVRVQIKVKLNGKADEVAKIKQLEDAIERAVVTKGYVLDIVFVDVGGAEDVFEFTVNFCEWANSGNWASGPTTLSHEVHHALGLPDRYDYIESHSKNEQMNVPMRLVWFEAEMDKTSPNNPRSKMWNNSNPLLNDDVCMVAHIAGPERDKCIEERAKFNPEGIP